MICFVLTIMLLSGLYKRIMIKLIRKNFLLQDRYSSFIDYSLCEAGFYPFRVYKFLKLDRLVDSDIYYKFMSKIYLFQVLFSILGFIVLLVLNYFDTLDILKFKF